MKDFQTELQEQIAFDLQRQFGSDFEYAWVTHQGKLYFSRFPRALSGPSSAVVKLVQFLFDDFVDQSFFILRNRIFSTASLSGMCEGVVQLAAKRATGMIVPVNHGQVYEASFVEIGNCDNHYLKTKHNIEISWKAPVSVEDPIEAYHHLQGLIAKIPRGDVLHDFNRQIAALICSKDGQLLSWAVNNNSKNKTLHAEVWAVQKYFDTHQCKLPEGSIIYSSLKPCRMCSAMLLHMAEKPEQVKAIYFQDDPGPLARNTELEKRKQLQHYRLHDAGQ